MRILYLSSATDTLGNHNHKFLKALVDNGYDTHLVSYHPLPIAKNIQEIKGLKIYHFPPKIIKKPFYFNRIFHFKRLLRSIKPDIIHSGNLFNESFLAALSQFHPVLVMPFGSDILIYPQKYKIFKSINKFIFLKVDWVTCDAEFVKKRIIADYKFDRDKITVFPWGIELDLFNSNIISNDIRKKLGWEDNIVLIMNRHFEPVYDHDTLINSFRLSIKNNHNLRLLLVGDGSGRNRIEKLIIEYELKNYINMTGKVSRKKMVELLNASDIYISTSKSDGTSVSLLEAMACKKPVIVSNIPVNREWIKNNENGFLVNVGDERMFSDSIIKLSKNMMLQKSMGEKNRRIALEKADWKVNFKKLQGIYNILKNLN